MLLAISTTSIVAQDEGPIEHIGVTGFKPDDWTQLDLQMFMSFYDASSTSEPSTNQGGDSNGGSDNESDPVKLSQCLNEQSNGYTTCLNTVSGWAGDLSSNCMTAAGVTGIVVDRSTLNTGGGTVTVLAGMWCTFAVTFYHDNWKKECKSAKDFNKAVCEAKHG